MKLMKKLFSMFLSCLMIFMVSPNIFAADKSYYVPVFGDNYEKQTEFIRAYVGSSKLPDESNDIYDMYKYISKDGSNGHDTIYFYNIKINSPEDKQYGARREQRIRNLLNQHSKYMCAIVYIDINNCTVDEMRIKTTQCANLVKEFNNDIQLIATFHDVNNENEVYDDKKGHMMDAALGCVRDIEFDYLGSHPGVFQFRNSSFFPVSKLELERDMKRLGELYYIQVKPKYGNLNILGKQICDHPVASAAAGVTSLAIISGIAWKIFIILFKTKKLINKFEYK